MYHVAVCDDDKVFISYIKQIIRKVADIEKCQLKIYEFYSGEELVQNLKRNIRYDLLILDMQLGGMDGNETARHFRGKYPDVVLAFCSGVCSPTVESFKATPYRYLLKSYSEEKFIEEMQEIFAEVGRKAKEPYIIGHYRNKAMKVKIKNIMYIENAKRGSRVIVSENCEEAEFLGQILIHEKLAEVSEKFAEFVFAHRSYIVNIDHVDMIKDNELFLDSGEQLSISRTYHKAFREAFVNNIGDKY